MTKLSDLSVNDIKIGQVVQYDKSKIYAVVIGIAVDIGGHFIDRNPETNTQPILPRYTEIQFLNRTGRFSSAFHMRCGGVNLVDRILKHYNLDEHSLGSEFYRFDKIVDDESSDWKLL